MNISGSKSQKPQFHSVSFITRDEEKRLASLLNRNTALLARFLLETGCTVSEGLRFLDTYLNSYLNTVGKTSGRCPAVLRARHPSRGIFSRRHNRRSKKKGLRGNPIAPGLLQAASA